MAAAYGQGEPRQPQAAPSPPFTPTPSRSVAAAILAAPAVLNDARAAIQKGADPATVRARLAAHGYDPGAL